MKGAEQRSSNLDELIWELVGLELVKDAVYQEAQDPKKVPYTAPLPPTASSSLLANPQHLPKYQRTENGTQGSDLKPWNSSIFPPSFF